MRLFFTATTIILIAVPAISQEDPGCISGTHTGLLNCRDRSYTHVDLVSDQTNTGPNEVWFGGPITPGDVVGFDYSFSHAGVSYVRQYRHTMRASDTYRAVLEDLGRQWKIDPAVIAAIGADIVSYGHVRHFGPDKWAFQFFENWPFVETGNPRLAVYLSPGATTRGGGSAGNESLEANPYWSCGRTIASHGRPLQKGDRLCNFYVTGDVTGRALDQRNVDQTYAQWEYTVIDPTPGVASARFSLQADTIDLDTNNLLIRGQPAGPVGVPGPQGPQGPPGGNIAGSIVQSPALAICADEHQRDANCAYIRAYQLAGMNITGWKTIATLTPTSTGDARSMSKVTVEIVADTEGAGMGSLESRAYISLTKGVPKTGNIGRNITQGSAPRVQLVPGPSSSLLLQVASADGTHPIASGFAKVEYMLAGGTGAQISWRID
jgi:hypothetical protein